jgi:hypothetical protein
LLAGDQIDPERPPRWLLIDLEVGVPAVEGGGYWSLDHFEVVGQMVDYAANSVALIRR